MAAQEHTERLLRRVETRAALRAELGAVARGILGTAAIFLGITGLLLAVIIGAILFARVLNAFAP